MLQYFNNAGAGLMSEETLNAVINHMKNEIKVGAYQAANDAKNSYEQFYIGAASLINASNSSQIAFMDSASRAWNMALYGSMLNKGDSIVTLSTEFGTNLISLFDFSKRNGFKVKVIKCDPTGVFDLNEIEKLLNDGAKMVAVSHATAHCSIINPVNEIGKIVKKYNSIYLVDGCQALGQIPVDINEIQCDAYTATGRKWLCAPRGTGFLFINSTDFFKSPYFDLSSGDLILDNELNVLDVKVRKDAKQFELWERNIAGMIGLSKAIENLLEKDIHDISNKISSKANKIRNAVLNNPKLNILGNKESESGITGFYLADPSNEKKFLSKFKDNGFVISTMSDWDCPLHFPYNGVSLIFRISPHYFTSDESVESICNFISEL